jgi:hypothetical protein
MQLFPEGQPSYISRQFRKNQNSDKNELEYTSGDLGGHGLPRGGHLWPQGVTGGLGGSGVALGVTNGLVGLQMASGAAGGFTVSWVASGGCS